MNPLTKLFKNIENCNKKQFILAGSIYPNSAYFPNPLAFLKKSFANLQVLSSENHDKIPENLRFNIIEIDENKENQAMDTLLDLVKTNPLQKFVIFSNFVARCMDINTALTKLNISSSLMIGDMDLEERVEEYIDFIQKNRVLITINIASRGLDLNADHIVLYNLPTGPSSLVSRIGRVCRTDREGIVTCFLSKNEIQLADCLRPGASWNDVFKFYSSKSKKKTKLHSVLPADFDEVLDK